jgi:hypothetical protein
MMAALSPAEASPWVHTRAWELLGQGAVTIRSIDPEGRVTADVVAYRVCRTAGGRWFCECAASTFGSHCCHVEATRLVTDGGGKTKGSR